MSSHSDSFGKAFVQPDEVTEGYGEFHGIRLVERIDTERVLESRHDDREAERIQPRLNQLQLIGQRRERPILLPCDLLELSRYRGLHRHLRAPLDCSLNIYYLSLRPRNGQLEHRSCELRAGAPSAAGMDCARRTRWPA